jgi:hypothetical protein
VICPATGRSLSDRVDGSVRLRVGLLSLFSTASIRIRPHSIPRLPRDFCFSLPENHAGDALGHIGLTVLSRSFP